MTVYEILLNLVQKHERIKGGCYSDMLRFDFVKKNIFKGKYFLMKNGALTQKEICLLDGTVYNLRNLPLLPLELTVQPFNILGDLYLQYKYSVGSGRSMRNKGNFRACTSDELAFEQLCNGEERIKAQYALEAYVLLGSVSGVLQWPDLKHWFWKSKIDPWLILYRDWF